MRKLMLVCGLMLALVVPAHTHSWYPQNCCSGQDCMRVERVETNNNGDYILYTTFKSQNVFIFISKDAPMQSSSDEFWHICLRYDDRGHLKPICVFVPKSA